ncbi:MAG: hypothetical protein ACKPE6_01630 [Gammaproteobacteria bacterium]
MSEAAEDPTLPEAVRDLLGQPCHARLSDIPANTVSVRALLAAVGDPSTRAWDTETPAAPPWMLSTWSRPELWSPAEAPPALALHHELKALLGYPVAVVSAIESLFHSPVPIGARVQSEQRLLSISTEKRTRLGTGRFWRIEVRYTLPEAALAGCETFECFGYRREPA